MTVSATQSATASTTAPKNAMQSLAGNFDTFLSLLTTQLKNQDPLAPLDTNEFTQQLVQFTGVEQSIKTNSNLEDLIDVQQAGMMSGAVGFLGTDVEVAGNMAALENGKATYTYAFTKNAATCEIVIQDSSGAVVRKTAGEPGQGMHQFTWNGLNDAGDIMPDGLYKISVTGKDAAGGPVGATTSYVGRVTGVAATKDKSGIILTVNGTAVPLADIKSVKSIDPDN